jgi:hypothetical protein
VHRRLVAALFLINKGTLFGYNLNSGNAKRASPGLHVVAEKGAFGLRTECFLQAAKIHTKSLRISQHKWIFSQIFWKITMLDPSWTRTENRGEWQ